MIIWQKDKRKCKKVVLIDRVPLMPATHPQFFSLFHTQIWLYLALLYVDQSAKRAKKERHIRIRILLWVHHHGWKKINKTDLLCLFVILLNCKCLFFNFLKNTSQFFPLLCKTLLFLPWILNPFGQLLYHFMTCLYLNLVTVDLCAIFIHILISGQLELIQMPHFSNSNISEWFCDLQTESCWPLPSVISTFHPRHFLFYSEAPKPKGRENYGQSIKLNTKGKAHDSLDLSTVRYGR